MRIWSPHKMISLLVLGAGFLASPQMAGAEQFNVTSRIDAVTVFPTGAEIQRQFTISLPIGDHVLSLLLPHDIERNSLQIGVTPAAEVSINSLDLRPQPSNAEERKARDAALRAEIAALEADISGYTKTIENARLSRNLVETLARRTLQPNGPDTAPPVPGPGDLTALLDMVDKRLSLISKTVLEAQDKADVAREQIEERRKKLSEPLEPASPGILAAIHVTAQNVGEASFQLTYRLSSASWQPLYEARLSTGEGGKAARLELVRNASVAQVTTEDWNDVGLTISTAQRTAQITPPSLAPQSVANFVREAEATRAVAASGRVSKAEKLPESEPSLAETVERMQASVSFTGFNVLFDIPGRVTIDHSGNAKSVRIGASTVPAALSLAASPKVDLTAYLIARFTVDGEAPLLPGRVMLFRDDIFVGEADLPLTTPGETLELGFGADDLVRIERREVASQSGETGLVSTAYIEERSYLTRITSGHSFNIPITIEDQTPVTDDERIRVEFLPRTARPDSEDVGGRSGVYSWTRVLKPGLTEEIWFGFRITWPKGISR